MNLDEKINLLIYPHIIFKGLKKNEDPIKGENIEGLFASTDFRVNAQALQEPIRLLQKINEAIKRIGPVMININYEGGNFCHINHHSLTQIPSAMALGSADEPKLTYETGKIIGTELRAIGISWNFAPVAELCLNPYFLSIGIRSFGDNPEKVGEHIYQFIAGMQSQGVAATAKHFPGAGITNYCFEDIYPLITNEFKERDLLPFRRAVEAGVAFIMPRYGIYTSIDPSEISVFSEKFVKGFLRERLQYNGVIVTDSLRMGSLSKLAKEVGIGNLAVKALKAGVDMILLESTISYGSTDPDVMRKIQENYREVYVNVHNAIKRAVLEGSLDIEGLARKINSVESVYSIKQPVDEDKLAEIVGKEEDRKIAYQIARRAVKVAYNNGVLPIDKSSRVFVVKMTPQKSNRADAIRDIKATLGEEIKKIGGTVDSLVADSIEDLKKMDLSQYDYVVVETYFGYLKFNNLEKQKTMIDYTTKKAKRIICVAKGIPLEVNGNVDAIIISFDIRQPTLRAIAEVLYEGNASEVGLPLDFSKHGKTAHPSFLSGKYTPKVIALIPTIGGEWLERTIHYASMEIKSLDGYNGRVIVGLNNFTDASEAATTQIQRKDGFILEKTDGGKLTSVRALVKKYCKEVDYLILMDDDIIPVKSSFQKMLDEISQTENCSYLVGGMPIPILGEDKGYFWRKVFSINRNDRAGLFYAPIMPWGQFLAMHKDSFPVIGGNLPVTINDSFFYLCSFFPNVKIAEDAFYYFWPTDNFMEYASRKKRLAKGISDVLEIMQVPLLGHINHCLKIDAEKDYSSLERHPSNIIYLAAYELANMIAYKLQRLSANTEWTIAHSTKASSMDYDGLYESTPAAVKKRNIDLKEIVGKDVAIPKKDAIYLME